MIIKIDILCHFANKFTWNDFIAIVKQGSHTQKTMKMYLRSRKTFANPGLDRYDPIHSKHNFPMGMFTTMF